MARVPRRCLNPDCAKIFWALGPEEHCESCQRLVDAILPVPRFSVPPVPMTMAERIESIKSPRGGFNRVGLKKLGVPWPPPKGWRRKLLRGNHPVDIKPLLDGRERRARALGGWYRDPEPKVRYKEHKMEQVGPLRWDTGWYVITDEGKPL